MIRLPVIAAAICSGLLLVGCGTSDSDKAMIDQAQRDAAAAKASAAQARQSADAARGSEAAARQAANQPMPAQSAQSTQFRNAQRK